MKILFEERARKMSGKLVQTPELVEKIEPPANKRRRVHTEPGTTPRPTIRLFSEEGATFVITKSPETAASSNTAGGGSYKAY